MSINSDGDSFECVETPTALDIGSKSNESFARESNDFFPPGPGFRGFEKVPIVLVARNDIELYLKRMNKVKSDGNNVKKLHEKRITSLCCVLLQREDFLLFRNATRENTKQVDDTSSSDTENEMVDPKMAVKCNICEKSYPTEKKLLKHQDKKHMIVYERPKKRVSFSDHVIVHEVKEYHKCRKCPKIFKEYKSLKAHSKLHHKKRKCYICNYCNKKFVDRVFFKVHIKLHCDVCGLLFSSKLKYLQHRHKACRIQKKHQCRICNESYFRYMDLKDHSLEHLRLCYVCDVCKEQFDTKCAIAHHLKFLHSGRRPRTLYKILNIGTERLYLCRFCDESSVDKRLIEKHTQLLPDLSNRAMTGYRDFYFCDQCMRKFSTETDMLQHKWTHFLKTSDNTQVQLQSVLVNKKPKLKTTYKVNDVIPERFNPKVVLEKLAIDPFPNYMSFNCKKFDIVTGEIKKAIVDPKSKKTIVSKHQCPVSKLLDLS